MVKADAVPPVETLVVEMADDLNQFLAEDIEQMGITVLKAEADYPCTSRPRWLRLTRGLKMGMVRKIHVRQGNPDVEGEIHGIQD